MKGKLCKVEHGQLALWGYPNCSSRYDEYLKKDELLLILGSENTNNIHTARWLVYSQRLRKKGTVNKRFIEVL